MGYSYGTHHFYGVHVPKAKYVTTCQSQEQEWIDAVIGKSSVLSGFPDLGHITSGEYDRHELFLCTIPRPEQADVELGQFLLVQAHTRAHDVARWGEQLKALADAAGYEGLGDPGWITSPYCV